jgi:hypothetical protein
MKLLRYGLPILLFFIFSIARGAETSGYVMKHLDAGGWMVMAHLVAIPEKYRDMAKATHHISIMATDENGKGVMEAKVTFEFVHKGDVVARGEAKYMAGNSGHGMQGGHYGADISLPDPGEYTLKITLTKNNKTREASTKLTAP